MYFHDWKILFLHDMFPASIFVFSYTHTPPSHYSASFRFTNLLCTRHVCPDYWTGETNQWSLFPFNVDELSMVSKEYSDPIDTTRYRHHVLSTWMSRVSTLEERAIVKLSHFYLFSHQPPPILRNHFFKIS